MTDPSASDASVDCHVHVFDPVRFPYDPGSDYVPQPHETATTDQLIAVLDSHRIAHALVVNPTSGYGLDNRVTLDAIQRYPERLRGIAVLAPETTEHELSQLKSAGIVGARIDLLGSLAIKNSDAVAKQLSMLRAQGMVAQFQAAGGQIALIAGLLEGERCPVVIDHMGWPDPRGGLGQEAFRCLLDLARLANVHIKLSGPFRFSQAGFPYADADPFAARLLSAFGPDRCVWGSDWPFVRMDHRLDYGPSCGALSRWVPDASARRTILCDTPRRLFGFGGGM